MKTREEAIVNAVNAVLASFPSLWRSTTEDIERYVSNMNFSRFFDFEAAKARGNPFEVKEAIRIIARMHGRLEALSALTGSALELFLQMEED